MKRAMYVLLILLVLAGLSLSNGCSCSCVKVAEKAYLNTQVTQHPSGGLNVAKVTCTYTVAYASASMRGESSETAGRDLTSPDPIDLKIAWVNDKGGRYNEETKTFAYDKATGYPKGGTFTTTWAAKQAGQVLDKTFWVVLDWTDSAGPHHVESKKAACTVR